MILGHIGAAIGDELVDHLSHRGDMLRRPRLDGGRQATKRGNVVVELLLGLLGDAADRLVQRKVRIVLRRPRIDLVVDVGDVAHIGDVLRSIEMAQQAEQHVEHDDGARIADMGKVVDRRPAHIHADIARIYGLERLLLASERVVEPERHQ